MVALATDNGPGLTTSVQVIAVLASASARREDPDVAAAQLAARRPHRRPDRRLRPAAGVLLKRVGTSSSDPASLRARRDADLRAYLAAFAAIGMVYGPSPASRSPAGAPRETSSAGRQHLRRPHGLRPAGIATLTPPASTARCSPTSPTASSPACCSSSSARSRTATAPPTWTPRRRHRRRPVRPAPRLGGLLAFAAVASLGLPGLAGFWGEMLAMFGAFDPADGLSRPAFLTFMRSPASAPCSPPRTCCIVVRRVCMGDRRPRGSAAAELADIQGLRIAAWTPLVVLTVLAGLWPAALLGLTDPAVRAPRRRQVVTWPPSAAERGSLVQSVDWLASRRPASPPPSPSWCSSPTCSSPSGEAAPRLRSYAGLARRARPAAPPATATGHLLPHRRARRVQLRRRPLRPRHPVPGARRRAAHRPALARRHRTRRLPAGEYWFLLLSSAAGAALLPASRDLATLVVALEVAPCPPSPWSASGAATGSPPRPRSSSSCPRWSPPPSCSSASASCTPPPAACTSPDRRPAGRRPRPLDTLAAAGVALTLVGFAFKAAAAPFHFWVPDTYVGAPLPIAAYLSVVSKAVGFSGLILVTVDRLPVVRRRLGPGVAVLAALTMTVGNVAALRQTPPRVERRTPPRVVVRRPGRLPPGPDRGRRRTPWDGPDPSAPPSRTP